jgi:hypothetical protein
MIGPGRYGVFMESNTVLRRIVILLWIVAGLLVVGVAWRLLFTPQPNPGRFTFPAVPSGHVMEAPDGHAYQYVAAPNLSWDKARLAAKRRSWQGHKGYLATIGSAAEFSFLMKTVFPEETDVTYLGGRQTAGREWRWVTGPEGKADNGKGALFWTGYDNGQVAEGRFATWMFSAFQHGGKWDVEKVCCVTLFSYRRRMFSTSLGSGDPDEGVAGYLVEYGE